MILDTQKTYGSVGLGKRIRYLYTSIPGDKNIPPILVPYNIKCEFSKKRSNLFVLVKIDPEVYTMRSEKARPTIRRGQLEHVFGSTEDESSLADYEIYRKGLQVEMKKFNQQVSTNLLPRKNDQMASVELGLAGSRSTTILTATIDADKNGCHDDALFFDPQNPSQISVVISDVSKIIDIFNLWGTISTRVSNIYLPHRLLRMLPKELSEHLSLNAGQSRPCVLFRFSLSLDEFCSTSVTKIELVDIQFHDQLIDRNFVYDETSLLQCDWYKSILELTAKCLTVSGEVSPEREMTSRELVSFWMRQTCISGGSYLANLQVELADREAGCPGNSSSQLGGIFHKEFPSCPGTKILKKCTAKYTSFNINFAPPYYLHLTSPIRRLVDLCNLTTLTLLVSPQHLSNKIFAEEFISTQLFRLETINKEVRTVQKLELECKAIFKIKRDPQLLLNLQLGTLVVFDHDTGKGVVFFSHLSLFLRIAHFKTEIPGLQSNQALYQIMYIQNKTTLNSKFRAVFIRFC